MKNFNLIAILFFSLFFISCEEESTSPSAPSIQASKGVAGDNQVPAPEHVPIMTEKAPSVEQPIVTAEMTEEAQEPVTGEEGTAVPTPADPAPQVTTVEETAVPSNKVFCVKEGEADIVFSVYNYEPGSKARLCEIFDSRSSSAPRWYATQDATFCNWLMENCLIGYNSAQCNDPTKDFRVPALPEGWTCSAGEE